MVRKQNKFVKILLSMVLALFGLFAAFPILWMVICSLKTNEYMFMWPPKLIDESMSVATYGKILVDPEKLRYFLNSYIVSGCVVILTLAIGIMAAYAFSRFNFKGKRAINSLIVSVQAIPPIVLLIPYMAIVVALNIFNTYWALILTYLVSTLPYCILMMTGYFNTLSRELDDSVRIDGGSRMRALWGVLVPIAKPGLISVGIYTFMHAWNEYLFALVLTQTRDMRTIPIGINLLITEHNYDWATMMGMSVLGSIPILILFVFFQRYFIAGMSSGAIKE
ncbi:MAG: carbohydrate ABC transporter permease [Christensenellales bacterium]|jgi:multiple sugar transport system permease protein